MKVEVRGSSLSQAGADAVAVGLCEGEDLPAELAAAPGAESAAARVGKATLLRPADSPPALVIGLGRRDEIEPERLRVAAATAAKQAVALEARFLAWVPPEPGDAAAEALVTGTILASWRFERFRTPGEEEPPRLESLSLLAPEEVAPAAEAARVCAEAQNRARDLQSTPANVATPSFLATRAEEIAAAFESVSVEVLGRAEIEAMGMGGLIAVSQGSAEEPRLIVLRYGGGSGEKLGLVGKGVTFDTGGISLKPGAGMHEMKMDMSGAAAVLEAVAAIAELGLALDLVAVVPSTENMPSGTAIKPGDVITQHNGKTVEVNNTDAEGRLIL
ncbi:MAG TPA: M17 family peptidase N-terminal domain-containing protein, partial [Solirubrobacterales bacterium]|nr:M17 family peptidase N-terminal domain-containing protein [Solirubrobacterales bacterium]